MPKGTTLEATREVAQQLEANMLNDLKGVKFSTVSVGGSSIGSNSSTSNTANIRFTLYNEKDRKARGVIHGSGDNR